MKPPTNVVLVLLDEDAADALPERVLRILQGAGLGVHEAPPASGVSELRTWMKDDTPPAAVVLSEGLTDPLSIARQVHRIAPLVQIVFLAGRARSLVLNREMTLTPMIGHHWTIADADVETLPRVLSDAVRATRQRANLRTTLDRMNLRIQEHQAVTDGDGVRRLIISDRYLASILEHAGDAILAVDRHGRIATWNRGASVLFGYGEVEALERHVEMLVPDDRAAALRQLVEEARTGASITRHEIRCVRAAGSVFEAEVTVAPVRDEAGVVASFSVIVRDVTTRKRFEASLQQANATLKGALEQLQATKQELLELNAKLEVQAATDGLTGLKNRVVFHASLVEMIETASHSRAPLSLLIIDVDHFKRINDTWGHLEGDRILKSIAGCLQQNARQQDVVARFGGEEFSILLPGAGAGEAVDFAERLRVACRDVEHVDLTISVGVACYRPGDNELTLVGRADEALYDAKRSGRNRVALADVAKT